jgi:hypothetical protein
VHDEADQGVPPSHEPEQDRARQEMMHVRSEIAHAEREVIELWRDAMSEAMAPDVDRLVEAGRALQAAERALEEGALVPTEGRTLSWHPADPEDVTAEH